MTGERVDDAQEWLLSVIARGGWRRDHAVSAATPDQQALTLNLPTAAESVRNAREFARAGLRAWGLSAMYEDVGLVVSELVTNALRHAGCPAAVGTEPARIGLSLLRTAGRLICAVTDPSDDIPVRREPDFAAQTGRGLHLVEAFSDSWNWAPLSGRGKVVWACFLIHIG